MASGFRTRLWVDGGLKAEDFPLTEVAGHLADERALVWVDLCDPDADSLTQLAGDFRLDARAVDDALSQSERTKATRYADHTFVTVYATALATESATDLQSRLLTTRVSIFVFDRSVVTIRHETDPHHPVLDIDEVVRRWDANYDLLSFGSPALLHGLLDVIVDGQFDTIQRLDDAVEDLEGDLFDDRSSTRGIQVSTFRVRKEIVELRRVVLPMREVINTLMRRPLQPAAAVSLDGWYSDLYDHVIRAAEWTESVRDLVTTVFETNLALQDARLNNIMKKLTGWAGIVAVPTAVTGWFGQNVPYPGFNHAAGAWASATIIALSSGLLYVVFKRRGWI
jgi:magnesium transporter